MDGIVIDDLDPVELVLIIRMGIYRGQSAGQELELNFSGRGRQQHANDESVCWTIQIEVAIGGGD